MPVLPRTTTIIPVYLYSHLLDDFSVADLPFEGISFVLSFSGGFLVTVPVCLCPSAVHSGRSRIQLYLSSLLSKLATLTALLFH